MNKKELSQHAILLAPSYQHGFLRVLFSSDPAYATIDIVTVENWLHKHSAYNAVEQLFQVRKLLAAKTGNVFQA